MTVKESAPEFSRPVAVDALTEATALTIEATSGEREALARRLGVLAIDRLAADLEVSREIGSIVHLSGRLEADLTQACVVTLVPLHTHIAAGVDRRYGPADALTEPDSDEIAFDDDTPDLLVGGVIDVGEAVSEQLALEVDPFPRAEGAEFAGYSCGPNGSSEAANPFSALERLVKKPK